MKLTVKQIKAAAEGARLQDGGGLYFERTKTGGRWVFRFQLNGKRRDMGLGTFPQLTLAQARDSRAKWSAVAKSGIDPIVERQKQRDAAAAAQAVLDPTFEDMVNETIETKKDSLKNETCQDR